MSFMSMISLAGPMDQFVIRDIIPFGTDGALSFTNAALWMFIAVGVACFFMFMATRTTRLVPGRTQAAGEALYEFVADMLRDSAGPEGMKFFPYIFTLFFFILLCNFLGLIPSLPFLPEEFHTFTPTSHIIVTFALAMLTISIVVGYGLYKNGAKFLRLFAPSGIPILLMPLMIVIEIISFLSRPVSLAIRLCANMFAGHFILKLFAGFAVSMVAAGSFTGVLSILPLAGNVAVFFYELLVAFLQAYIFAILSCIYLSDAIHPGH